MTPYPGRLRSTEVLRFLGLCFLVYLVVQCSGCLSAPRCYAQLDVKEAIVCEAKA